MCWSLVILSDKHISYVQISNLFEHKIEIIFLEEHSGSVVECLIRDRGAASSSWRHCVVSFMSKPLFPLLGSILI